MENGRKRTAVPLLAGVLLCAMVLSSPVEGAVRYYVTQNGTGTGTGSWADALGEQGFRDRLVTAADGDVFRVAAGKYRPSDADRIVSFALKSGVSLYGGFAGNETELNQRDWSDNITVLTGDLDFNDTTDTNGVTLTADDINSAGNGNSYSVLLAVNVSNTAVLDGFTITAGNADWTDTNTGGAKQCGGGMHNTGSHAVVRNCSFRGNTAEWGGGAIYNSSSDNRFGYCTFSGNGGRSGAAMYNHAGSPELVSCTFSGNTVRTDAGAPSDDQRGYPRPQGSAYDIGSYEFAPSSDSSGCSALSSGGMAPLLLLFGK